MNLTHNQKINSLKKMPKAVILKDYNASKLSLTSLEVAKKFYATPGFSIDIFEATKNWFDTDIISSEKRGLNIQGYMRLIAM